MVKPSKNWGERRKKKVFRTFHSIEPGLIMPRFIGQMHFGDGFCKRSHSKNLSINYDGKGGVFIRPPTFGFPADFYQEQESYSFLLLFCGEGVIAICQT